MKKQLAILSDNNNARLVIDHIVGYYLTVNEKKDKPEYKLEVFLDYPYQSKPVSEDFFYNNKELLNKDAELIDSFFDARDVSKMSDQERLDSLV